MIGVLISAWLDVRSKPLRTFAAIAGMVAAIAAVMLVDATGIMSRDANNQFIIRRYGRTATIGIQQGGSPPMSDGDAASASARLLAVLNQNDVTLVTRLVPTAFVIVAGDGQVRVNPTWVSSTFSQLSFLSLVVGTFPVETATAPVPHAVISLSLAQQLGYSGADAVGTSHWFAFGESGIDLRTAPLHPVVIDAVAQSIGTETDPSDMLIVSDLPQPFLNSQGTLHWIVRVNSADVNLVQDLVASVTAGSPPQPIFDARRIDLSADLAPLLDQQGVTAKAVTWVALIVGGLGILGVGLASVRERGKDFGLRRALGASKRRIFAGVIVQTLLEVLLAAAIAIPLAAIAVELFARRLVLSSLPLPASTDLPISSAVRGLVAALIVGLLAGLLPAFRAVRTSVVQALRD